MKKITLLLGSLCCAGALYAQPTARVQVIHNAADLAADTVAVFLNDQLLLPDFAFRTASPFVDAPAGVPIDLVVQPGGATDTSNALFRTTVTLDSAQAYVVVAAGIVSDAGYTPAPPFGLFVFTPAREASDDTTTTDLLVFHGSTDAPTVTVAATGSADLLVEPFDFGDFAPDYLSLPTDNYSVDVRAADGQTVVATFAAPLATLNAGGAALTVLASGFLDPSENSNGPAFGLFVALPTGGPLLELDAITSLRRTPVAVQGLSVFPNPVVGSSLHVNYELAQAGQVEVGLYNLQGQHIRTWVREMTSAAAYQQQFALPKVVAGMYLLRVQAGQEVQTVKLAVQ